MRVIVYRLSHSDLCATRFVALSLRTSCLYNLSGNATATRPVVHDTHSSFRRSIYSILTYRTLFFLVVIIELSRNSVFQLYCQKDYYKQKQWNILQVSMITEIINFNRLLYYVGCHGNSGKYLCLAILTNNEECQFSRSTTCLGQTYTCVIIMCI